MRTEQAQDIHSTAAPCYQWLLRLSSITPYLLKALQSHVGFVQFILELCHFILQLSFEALQRRHLARRVGEGERGKEGGMRGKGGREGGRER